MYNAAVYVAGLDYFATYPKTLQNGWLYLWNPEVHLWAAATYLLCDVIALLCYSIIICAVTVAMFRAILRCAMVLTTGQRQQPVLLRYLPPEELL